jgi:hypothetical protein
MSNAWKQELAMKNGGMRKVAFGAVLLVAAGGLWAADHYKVVDRAGDFYYGHVSYIEDGPAGAVPTILREGRAEPEAAVINLPVGPGDTVRTTAERRVEIQFDTGTIVRLDFATALRVETILARSLSQLDQLSVMTLDRGRIYIQYREYDRKEMFQVLTSNAAVRLKHNSVALIALGPDGATEAQVKYGRGRVLFGPDERSLDERAVQKGERLIVLADHQAELATAIDGTAFELWNNEVNAHYWKLRGGLNAQSALPKPVQRLTPAVFYFAQTYGSRWGEWLWDELYGYVWRPYIDNGAYPGGWQPYYYGQWASYGSQMFWIPGEPWGWIPYHLGVWHWSKKIGWVWLPGSMFAPAWATWDFYHGYACWRPWGLYDWMYGYYDPYGWSGNFRSGFRYSDGVWDYLPYGDGGTPPTVVRRGQLKHAENPSYPISDELRRVLKNVTAASNRGDARVREDAAAVARHLVFVDRRDIGAPSIERKALTWDRVPRSGAPADGSNGQARRLIDPQREASRILRGLDGPSTPPRKIATPPAAGTERGGVRAFPPAGAIRSEAGPSRSAAPAPRFRDWNPDLRVARELGVHIEYAGARNEVRCPELRFSSSDREVAGGRVPHLTSHGIAYGPATSVGGDRSGRPNSGSGTWGDAGSSSSSGSSGTSDPSSSRGETRGSGETKGGGGEKIKK